MSHDSGDVDFSRRDYNGPPLTNLADIIEYVKPTALFGLSTIKVIVTWQLSRPLADISQGAFNQEVIEAMAANNARPIIFPLSNPVRLSECEFDEALKWTNGRVLFASGSPFPDAIWEGKVHYPGQGNNMYIFPGQQPFYLFRIVVPDDFTYFRPGLWVHPVSREHCH